MDLAGLKTRFRLYNPEITTDVISNTDLVTIFNDAQTDIVMRTNCLWDSADSTVTAGVAEYAKPSDSLEILSVWHGGSGAWEELPLVTFNWLSLNVGDDWITDSGEPQAWYNAPEDKVGIWKTPTSSYAGTNYLRQYYIKTPTVLSGDSDTPFNGEYKCIPYHELILLFAQYHAKGAVGKYGQADSIEMKYLAKCKEMKINVAKTKNFMQAIRPYYKGCGGASLKQNPLDQ